MADAAAVDIPRYRTFCATWGSFRSASDFSDLEQTSRNAVALTTALRDIGALHEDPTLVHDSKATACVDELESFLEQPGEDLLLYFASHGLVPSGASSYFRLATADTQDISDMSRALAMGEVIDRLNRAGDGRKLLIIDACYSAKAAAALLANPSVDLDLARNTCVLFATNPFEAARAPTDEALTTFTGDLAAMLATGLEDRGPVLSMRSIYSALVEKAEEEQSPEPFLVSTGTSAENVTFRNLATGGGGSDAAGFAELVAEFDHRTEILYVDDEEDLREKFRAELEGAGHGVTLAEDPIEGHEAIEAGHFDIIVIDLLLHGDSPATDFIQLCADEAPDSLLFLVSRQTKGSKDTWKRLGAIFQYPSRISTFLWKPEYVNTIKQHANRIRSHRRSTLSHIDGLAEAVNRVAERIIERNKQLGSHSERLQLEARTCVERLVEKWFPQQSDEHVYIERMEMKPVDGGRSSNVVFTLIPTLAGIEAESVTPLILKLGPHEEIAEEVRRYDRYVEVGVPLDVRTDKVASTLVGNVGGVIYSFRGADDNSIQDLSQLGPDDIEECFDLMFGEQSPKRWYASSGTGAGIYPTEHFANLGFPDDRFDSALDDLERSRKKSVAGLPPEGPEQVDHLIPAYERMTRDHKATLVHGDLTLENLVKINAGRFAIIDYRTVGLGPRLIDFVTLEIACWLLARAPADTPRSARFVDAYASVPRDFSVEAQGAGTPDWLRTPAYLAARCRELALRNHANATSEEYGELLWLAALRTSEFRSRATSAAERNAQKVLLPAIALAAQALIASD